MIKNMMFLFGCLFAFLLFCCISYAAIRTGIIFINAFFRKKRLHSKEFRWKYFLSRVKEHRYWKPIEFVKWVAIDIVRGKDGLRLWGIWAFCGYYGTGKTMGCVQFAKQLQAKYPHRDIKIYSNIYVKGQSGVISHWEELLTLPPNSIFIYDESQADFSANNRDFPEDLLRKITQCRKKKLAMFMTSPKYNRMNINIRESVNFVIECSNLWNFDRWFKYVFYRSEDYEQYRENKLKFRQNRYLTLSFVVNDRDYGLYNTVEEVDSIKGEEVKNTKKNVIQLEEHFKKLKYDILREVEKKYIPTLEKKK